MIQNMREGMQQAKQAQRTPVTVHYFHCDHLGTPIALTDQDGNIVWAARHDPWGNIEEEYNPHNIEQNIRMPGQYCDRESGLYYNYRRYYDPKVGAYINQDPIGVRGGVNLSTYVRGDPINLIDPIGLQPAAIPVITPFGPVPMPIPPIVTPATIGPPPGGWPPGFEYPPKIPDTSPFIEIPTTPPLPPPKPNCESQLDKCVKLTKYVASGFMKATGVALCFVQYLTCKKFFGGDNNG